MVKSVSIPPSVDLPPGVRRESVNSRRGRLAALAVGERPTVLLVPGFTGSKEDFLPLLPLLHKRGVSATAIDLLGQYESVGTDDPSQYTLAELASDVVDVAHSLGGGVNLVGHSMGGLVSRAAVIAQPELFRSLVLLDSGPAAMPTQNQPRARALSEALRGMSLAQIWEAKLELDAAAGIEQPPPPMLDFLKKRWLDNNPLALAAMVEILLGASDETDALAEAARASGLPLLVAYGEGDVDSWPTQLQDEMAERLGAPAASIPLAGHSPPAENPEDTAVVLTDFWARSAGSEAS